MDAFFLINIMIIFISWKYLLTYLQYIINLIIFLKLQTIFTKVILKYKFI